MREQRGYTLLELITYLSLASVGLFTGYTVWGADQLTSRRHTEAFRRYTAVSATLDAVADDLRKAVRVAPRSEGPGGLIFQRDGAVVAWYDRADTPGALYRKEIKVSGKGGRNPKVIARGITGLVLRSEGKLVTATATAGEESREITVRRRP
jgi:type II secretory pathway component PulJ